MVVRFALRLTFVVVCGLYCLYMHVYTAARTRPVRGQRVAQQRQLEHRLQQEEALAPPQPAHALDQVGVVVRCAGGRGVRRRGQKWLGERGVAAAVGGRWLAEWPRG